ncbi:MAG TPA: helix-turn-helix domain-containing protein, partial [Lachnospiraceae bacterium]|nr:helix-turn-helix domain-containing protein [Lachnospiraceae bacterium]
MEENVRLIERTFHILEVLSLSQQPMSLSEIVRESGMSKTTVYRLLTTMNEMGYIQKNNELRYSIGYKFMELASYHINHLELQTEAKPFLTSLYSELNLTVHLGTLEG